MTTIVITYLSYVCLSVALTVWVAQTLHKNGRIFLVDVFHGNEALADSVNHLLVVGFYLINFGYVTLALKIGYQVRARRRASRRCRGRSGWCCSSSARCTSSTSSSSRAYAATATTGAPSPT